MNPQKVELMPYHSILMLPYVINMSLALICALLLLLKDYVAAQSSDQSLSLDHLSVTLMLFNGSFALKRYSYPSTYLKVKLFKNLVEHIRVV